MSDIGRWAALKLKMAIRLRQKTTTSTLSNTSDRCSLALTRASRPFAGRLHHRSKRKRASGRLIADYEARLGFVRGKRRSIHRPAQSSAHRPSHDVEAAPRSGLLPYPSRGDGCDGRNHNAHADQRVLADHASGGILMSSRAISASNSARCRHGGRQSQNHIDRSVHVVTINMVLANSFG